MDASGIGSLIIGSVGPRTQDIMLAARTLWFRAVFNRKARPADVASAVDEIVTVEDAALRRTWEDLSPVQQRVLRAVAAGAEQLHSQDTRGRFGLGPSSSVTTALEALSDRAILGRRDGSSLFDSPFFRRWVEREVLAR